MTNSGHSQTAKWHKKNPWRCCEEMIKARHDTVEISNIEQVTKIPGSIYRLQMPCTKVTQALLMRCSISFLPTSLNVILFKMVNLDFTGCGRSRIRTF